jgi:uncharacterized protein
MRTGKVILGYVLLTVAIMLLGTILGQLAAMLVSKFVFPNGRQAALAVPITAAWFQVLILTGPAVFITGLLATWIKYRETGSIRSYLPGSSNGLLAGMVLGIAFWLTVVSVAWIDGGVSAGELTRGAAVWIPLITLLGWLLQAVSEELLFRGWLLSRLNLQFGATAAIIVSAAIFSITHGLNPDTTPIAYFNLFLGGIWFALLANRFGGVAVPVMAHLAWNWLEGSFFGLASKGDDPQGGSVLNFGFTHPTLMAGPGTGLNDGLALGLAFLLFIGIEIVLRTRRANRARQNADQERVTTERGC